jgi:hypothetical protein
MRVLFFPVLLVVLVILGIVSAADKKFLYKASPLDCPKDISKSAKDAQIAFAAITAAYEVCQVGDFNQQCNVAIASSLAAVAATSSDVTAAIYDCSAGTANQCAKDINGAIVDGTMATTAILNAALDCPNGQYTSAACINDVKNASISIASMSFHIAEASGHCQS